MMPDQSTRQTNNRIVPSEKSIRVHERVLAAAGVSSAIVPLDDEQAEEFTQQDYEDALDKVSRPVKGKYADVLPSSEEFIRDKRKEVELEDR